MPGQITIKPFVPSNSKSLRSSHVALFIALACVILSNQVNGQACDEGAGSCFEPNATPGCDCSPCCELVCEFDPICCDVEWDFVCVENTVDFCGLDCNDNGIADACEDFEDCNQNGIPDDCDLDCNDDGIPDDCHNDQTIDCNQNGMPDREEGPTFCPEKATIPVDLIAIADPSGSDNNKLPSLCSEVFEIVADRLDVDFDLQAAWTSVVLDAPADDCRDWTMPAGTAVPVCANVEERVIDDEDGEEWGDATAVLTTPGEDHLLGQLDGWTDRDAVLILIPISDEAPQNGDDIPGDIGGGEDGTCDCLDEGSKSNLIKQAVLMNAQIIPMPTPETDPCVYDNSNDAESGMMHDVAQGTLGSVVDARNWPTGKTSEELADELEAAIRLAIEVSPRIRCVNECPWDFTGNGQVDGGDLSYLLGNWGQEAADVNGDGTTDGGDLAMLLAYWGPCP